MEYGGYLRVVTLDKDGFQVQEIKNNVTKYGIPASSSSSSSSSSATPSLSAPSDLNHVFVAQMKKSKFIKEKPLGNNISSFNFTDAAFTRSVWNSQTIKARGLFINTSTFRVSS